MSNLLRYQVLLDYFLKHSKIVTNQLLNKRIEDVNKKTPNSTGMVKNTDHNIKTIETDNRISSHVRLATTTALNAKVIAIENKIPDITDLATKVVLNMKITEIENKILVIL